MAYRLLVSQITDPAEFVAELAYISATWTDTFNDAGSASVTVPLDSTVSATIGTGTHCLWVERAGVLLWGGIIWATTADTSGRTVTLQAAGWHSYTRRRTIRQTLTYSATDQLNIARDLIDKMEAVSGSLGLIGTTETTTSGRTRDRTYYWWDRKNFGEALDQLSAVNDGFDFRYQTAYAAGVPTVEFVTTYPATGRDTGTVLVLGGNVETLTETRDATQTVTEVDAIGSGNGPQRLIQTATDPARLGTYPLLQAVQTFGDITGATTLKDHASRRLARGVELRQITMRLNGDGPPTIGGTLVGDVVTVKAADGWISIDGRYRVMSATGTVGPDGESQQLVVSSWEAFGTL